MSSPTLRAHDVAPQARLRRRGDAVAVAVGGAVLAAGMVIVRDGTVPEWERSIFHAINDLPGWLYPVLWPFQQVGALAAGFVVALVALLVKRRSLAARALFVTIAKLGLERLVKLVSSRQRPGTSIGADIHARGDVSLVGESFVSGHALLVAALVGVALPYLPGRWQVVTGLVAATVLVARVYVGAHNPLDVLCGAGLGVALASSIHLVAGVRPRRATS